jgi:hypothetical protein
MQFPSDIMFSAHLENHQIALSCHHPLCGLSFESTNDLVDHMLYHGIGQIFAKLTSGPPDVLRCKTASCENKGFENLRECWKHIGKHEVKICPYRECDKDFPAIYSLRQHVRLSHQIQSHMCIKHLGGGQGLCKQEFRSRNELITHEQSHEGNEGKVLPDLSAFGITME